MRVDELAHGWVGPQRGDLVPHVAQRLAHEVRDDGRPPRHSAHVGHGPRAAGRDQRLPACADVHTVLSAADADAARELRRERVLARDEREQLRAQLHQLARPLAVPGDGGAWRAREPGGRGVGGRGRGGGGERVHVYGHGREIQGIKDGAQSTEDVGVDDGPP